MKYFAFGSNMSITRIKKRLEYRPPYEVGFVEGYKLVFNKQAYCKPGVGYANIIPSENDRVYGILYDVTNGDLSKLDIKEGVADNHYVRSMIDIHVDDTVIQAVTYIAHESRIVDNLLPEKEYLAHLLAARDLLPDEYIQKLENHPTTD